MKRLIALLLMLLFAGCTFAETTESRDASWFSPVLYAQGSRMHLLTEAQLTILAKLPSEDVHTLVEALFLAAAGVEKKSEVKLWKTYNETQRAERSAQNAAYRAQTLPWLLEALSPGNRPAEADAAPTAATPAPAAVSSLDEVSPDPTAAPPAWTLQEGMAAFRDNEYGAAYLAMLAPYGGTDGESCMAVTQAVLQRWLAEIDHDKLTGQNSHYQFWLYAPDTPLDYPVVQCGNNSYYLDRMFNRKANSAGTIFVDARNMPGFRDPNTLVYGHHMRNGSMFFCLTNYDGPGYYEAHPYLLAVGPETIYLIEAFAGYVTDGSDHCYDIAISDEADMRAFVMAAEEKSDFDAQVDVDCAKDRLITLSTCAYNFENARYIVIGRLDLAWAKAAVISAE